MAKQRLASMPLGALMKLRDRVGAIIDRRATALKKELRSLGEDYAEVGRIAVYGRKKKDEETKDRCQGAANRSRETRCEKIGKKTQDAHQAQDPIAERIAPPLCLQNGGIRCAIPIFTVSKTPEPIFAPSPLVGEGSVDVSANSNWVRGLLRKKHLFFAKRPPHPDLLLRVCAALSHEGRGRSNYFCAF